jgi:hypothetical protein
MRAVSASNLAPIIARPPRGAAHNHSSTTGNHLAEEPCCVYQPPVASGAAGESAERPAAYDGWFTAELPGRRPSPPPMKIEPTRAAKLWTALPVPPREGA